MVVAVLVKGGVGVGNLGPASGRGTTSWLDEVAIRFIGGIADLICGNRWVRIRSVLVDHEHLLGGPRGSDVTRRTTTLRTLVIFLVSERGRSLCSNLLLL